MVFRTNPEAPVLCALEITKELKSYPQLQVRRGIHSEKILGQLTELSKQRYVSDYTFALAYLGLGNKEEALRWVKQSYQDRAGSDIGWIRVDGLLDPLRADPRFEAIAEKIVPAREFKRATAAQ